MNKLLPAITLITILASCSTSKDYLAHRNEDKTFYSIIKQLNKKPADELATAALPEVYTQLQQTHLANIENYKNDNDLNRYERIHNEYSTLQSMYNEIINSSAANKLVTANSYQRQIDSTREMAADDYYQLATEYYNRNNWEDYRKAYTAFKKADGWINNYNSSEAMMDSSRRKGIVSVVINPVQDNSFFFNSGMSNGFDLSAANFPQNLTTDLGGKSGGRYPAKFYTDWLAQRDNVDADWTVDLTLKNVNIPSANIYNYTRNVSAKIEDGKDTTGKTLYKTVYATMHIQRRSFNATAQMDMNVNDVEKQKNIVFDTFSDSYNWQQEVASYSGDSRALSNRDWELVNNRYYQPAKEEVLSELYRGLYPQVKNRISSAVNW